MTEVGALNVKITGDSSDLKSEMKKAGDAIKKGATELRSQINEWGKWGLAVSGAAVTASSAIVQSNLKSIQELRNLANVANTSVAELERNGFAAQSAGVSLEDYAEVLRDVNDRVGDFLTTGAGPMADFFEKIAPQVGVTAEQFKGLSGPQALQLYVDTLEKANVNQQEFTFFMEAMSSNSTELLPLLRNNGKAMQEQANAAKDLGIGLSNIEVENAIEAQKAIDQITSTLGSQTMKVVAELAPAITLIADEFLEAAKSSENMGDVVISVARSAAQGLGVMLDGVHGIQLGAKGVELAFQGVKSLVLGLAASIQTVGSEITSSLIQPIADFLALANDIPGLKGDFDEIIKSINDFNESEKKGAELLTQKFNDEVSKIQTIKDEMKALALESLPSEKVDEFFNKLEQSVVEARERVQEASKQSIDKAATPEPQSGKSNITAEGSETPDAIQERMQSETEMILEMLGLRFQSQEELLLMHLQEEQRLLQEDLDKKKISQTEFDKQSVKLAKQTEAAKKAVMIGGARDILNVLAENSEAALGLQKAFAIAQAGVSIATGIARAQELGFPANLAEMARIADVANDVYSSIRGATKGAASIPGGSTASSTPAAAPAPQQQAQQIERVLDVRLTGSGFFTQDMIRNDIIPGINEAVGDGVTVRSS